MGVTKRRLFVGNLPLKVSESAIKKKLGRFGNVLTVEMKQRTDSVGEVLSSFAFVDIETDSSNLDTCFKYFENELWNNERVKVQLAKESFMERLKREQNSLKKPPENILHASGESEIGDRKSISCSDVCNVSVNNKILFKDPDEAVDKNTRRYPSVSPFGAKKSKQDFPHDRLDGRGDWNKSIEGENNFDMPLKARGLPMFAGTKMFADLEDSFKGDGTSGNSDFNSHKLAKKSEKFQKDLKRNLKEETASEGKDTKNISLKIINSEIEVNDERKRTRSKVKDQGIAKIASKISPGGKCFLSQDDVKVHVEHTATSGALKIAESRGKKSISDNGTDSVLKNDCSSEKYDWRVNNFNCKEKGNVCSSESRVMETQEGARKEKSIKKMRNANAEEKLSRHSECREAEKSKNDIMADQKRLNALQERKKMFALQKDAVKKALSSIDSKTSVNKKVIFDNDSDEEITYQENGSTRSKITDNSKPKLFDDSSGDEELNELETKEFKIKPQFEGPQGQKLLAIQSRYANDSRFNLDERFLESDDERKSGEEDEAQEGNTEEDLNAEKNRQLSILQDMLGVDVSTKKPKLDKPDKKRNSLQMVRFDPTNPEHSQYLVTEEELKKRKSEREVAKKSKKGELDEDMSKRIRIEEEPLPVVTERFYKVSDKLKESLKKHSEKVVMPIEEDQVPEESSGGFSLLKKFGAASVDDEKEEAQYTTKDIAWEPKEWEKNPFKYDSSDDEEEEPESLEKSEEAEAISDSKPPEEDLPVPKSACERFYFLKNDPRLQEGLEFFTVKKTFSEMQEGFHEKRADLKSIIKAKVRNNKRRKKPIRKKLGGARKFKKRMGKR